LRDKNKPVCTGNCY